MPNAHYTIRIFAMLCGLFAPRPRPRHPRPDPDPDYDLAMAYLATRSTSPEKSVEAMTLEISHHSQPIIEFAITQLNAELIIFLRAVSAWKSRWSRGLSSEGGLDWDGSGTVEDRRKCYAHAALVFYVLVDEKAEYPVNIHPIRRNSLAVLFRCAHYKRGSLSASSSSSSVGSGSTVINAGTPPETTARPATPWDALKLDDPSSRLFTQQQMVKVKIDTDEALKRIQVLPADRARRLTNGRHDSTMQVGAETEAEEIDAPEEFNMCIFEEAVKEVKMQAYHNVWLPFIASGEGEKANRQGSGAQTDGT